MNLITSRKICIAFAFTASLFAGNLMAQDNVGIGTNTPNADAILEMLSTSKGLLIPRMTTAQRLAIVAPPQSLLVYDINFDCYFYWNASIPGWQSMCSNSGPTGPTGANGANGATGANGANGATD